MEGKSEPLASSALIIVQMQSVAGKNMRKMSTKNIILSLQGSIIGSSLIYLAHFLSFYLRKGYDSNKSSSQTEKRCYWNYREATPRKEIEILFYLERK